MDSGCYTRQFRRRVVRQWNKIKVGRPCTRFVESNNLFTLPNAIYFQAVKFGDDLMCVYFVGMFEFRDELGFLGSVVICQLAGCLFRSLGFMELGFASEEELEEGEEIIL